MRRVTGITLLLGVCLTALPAAASTFVAMAPRALVGEADAVIQGRVADLHSYWTEQGRMVATDVRVTVDEVIVGDAPAAVTVKTFGGQVGDFKVEAHGFPAFEEQERVLLFLKRDPEDGMFRVLGYQQGQFRVVTRRDGVTLAVPMIDEGARFYRADGRPAPEPRSVEIEHFKHEVRELAARVRPADGGPVVK